MRDEKYLLVTNKDGSIICKLRERDGIFDCKLTEKQNDNSILTFNMLTSSEKYPILVDPENLIIAGGRVFSAIYDGNSLTEKKDSGNKNTAAFSFVERQCLLDKVRVTVYNSTTTYDHIDEGMVVVLSGGIAPLTVNGTDISEQCPYEKGTAAYALYAVLYGTEWSVGTVDVDGTFDLETDKKSVLENVKAIQSLWGGILIFDSLERKIHLRSEEIYRPYNGFGVRFKFNETGLERTVNRNIITRLYVYGKDNLNIAASNGGKEYLENYSYTSTPLCGVMVNNDITNAGDLIVWGKRELEKVCKPQVTLKLSLIDRSQTEGGISFEVSDIIDVVDEDLSASKYQARVTEKITNFFQPWECTVTLGDEKEIFAAKVKYALENADKVNNLLDLFNRISSDDINMSGTKQSMTSYVQLTNEALEAGFKVIGVDGYERTGKTKITIDGIDVYNGGIVVRDRQNDIKIYMDGQTGNIIFSGNLYGASGTFSGALEAATGTFTGELKAATGSFSGDITALGGYIGSWQILDGGIINENNALALTSEGEIIAANGNFQVDKDGKLIATGAEISGDFSASSGKSKVQFSENNMLIYFAGYDDSTGLISSECKISPNEFYFFAYENGEINSGIAYRDGQLEITGKITATSGEIGGWLIEDDRIKAKNGSMVLYADGTIESCDGIDGDGNTVSGALVSRTGNEKTVIRGGRINMYCWNDELNDGYGGWEREGAVYTNKNFGGGLCLESVDDRPIVFGVGGVAVARIIPAEKDDEGNITEETHFDFRSGTKIYREKITTKNVEFTNSPLLTKSQDVVGAINELFRDGEGGGDEWQPPAEWPSVPDANEYELVMLIYVPEDMTIKPLFSIQVKYSQFSGFDDISGSEYIDWGDGTITSIVSFFENHPHRYTHFYSEAGYYVIKIHASEAAPEVYILDSPNSQNAASGWMFGDGSELRPVSSVRWASLRIIKALKMGTGLKLQEYISQQELSTMEQKSFRALEYLKFCGDSWQSYLSAHPTFYFVNLYILKRLDFDNPPTYIPGNFIMYCRALQTTNAFENAVEIPSNSDDTGSVFSDNYALKTLKAPKCKKIQGNAFNRLYALTTFVLPDDCEYHINTSRVFEYCPVLTPPLRSPNSYTNV